MGNHLQDQSNSQELSQYEQVREACTKYFKNATYESIAALFPNQTGTGIDWASLKKELARREYVQKTDPPSEEQRSAVSEYNALFPEQAWTEEYLNSIGGSDWPNVEKLQAEILVCPQSKLNPLLREIERLYHEKFIRQSEISSQWLRQYLRQGCRFTGSGYRVPNETSLNSVVAIGRAREQDFMKFYAEKYKTKTTAEMV